VEPDGLVFLADTVQAQPIREEDAYGGRRVAAQARLGPARLTIQVDIGVGDAVTPAPQWLEYPSLLDLPRPRLRAYPREAVVAEKLHAMVVHELRNSRFKDYFDVHALLREGALDATQLARTVASTFERRQTAVPAGVPEGLRDAFAADPTRRAMWQAFLSRNRIEGPPLDHHVVREIRDGLTPVLDQARRKGRA
jgi:hypothetical protein